MGIKDRGFASMDRERRREIASMGGRAAHLKGTAHEWTTDEARAAGHKGGVAHHRRRREYLGDADARPAAATADEIITGRTWPVADAE